MELVGIVFLLFLVGILRYITRNPQWIGGAAEKRVQRILSGLPQNEYITINDVLIRRPNGNTTQIDHVVVSPYGVFVMETKNYHGYVHGQETRSIGHSVSGDNVIACTTQSGKIAGISTHCRS